MGPDKWHPFKQIIHFGIHSERGLTVHIYKPRALRKCQRWCEYLEQKSDVAWATPSRQLETRLRSFADSAGWGLLAAWVDDEVADVYDDEYLASRSLCTTGLGKASVFKKKSNEKFITHSKQKTSKNKKDNQPTCYITEHIFTVTVTELGNMTGLDDFACVI